MADSNSNKNRPSYKDLLEQINLLRKQIILVHEQLSRIESKIDNQVARANARILLR